jgi:hypothetical protein
MPKRFGSEEEKREYQRQATARYREAHPDRVEAAKPAAAERMATWAQEHPERHRENVARWRREFKERDPEGFRKYNNERGKEQRDKVKAETVAAYGGKCQCPGYLVTDPEFLTMHHVQGNGAEHRNQLFPRGANAGYRFYLWLKRNGYPKGDYELHCYNCNCSKGFNGYCPHERARPLVV